MGWESLWKTSKVFHWEKYIIFFCNQGRSVLPGCYCVPLNWTHISWKIWSQVVYEVRQNVGVSKSRKRRILILVRNFELHRACSALFSPSFIFLLTSPLLEITQFPELPQYASVRFTVALWVDIKRTDEECNHAGQTNILLQMTLQKKISFSSGCV